MYTVTDKFMTHINRSGRRRIKVDLMVHTTILEEDLPIVSGNLVYDRKATIRSHGQMKLASRTLDWTTFQPWGTFFKIWAGIIYPDGSEELIPMGRFHLEDVAFAEGAHEVTDITFYDRLKIFDDVDGWEGDLSGRWAADWIINEMRPFAFSYGDLPWTWDICDYRLPAGSVYSGSNLATANSLVRGAPEFGGFAAGGEIWMDRDGGLVIGQIAPITSATTTAEAVADFSVGINLFDCNRIVTREGAYNAVYVPLTNNAAPYALAYDSDPSSPTYYNGYYGRKLKRLNIPAATNYTQALGAAQRELQNTLGLINRVRFTAPLNPALDVGDIITLFYFDSSVEIHQIESIQMDLTTWVMTVETNSLNIRS